MHRSGRLFSSKNIPSLIGLVLAASLGVACGGSTDDNLGNSSTGGAAGQGGSAGSGAGTAGSGNSTGGSSAAGTGGSGTGGTAAGAGGVSTGGTSGAGGTAAGAGGTGVNGCIPGQVVSCPCPGGQPPGAQTCLANGTFDACQCLPGTGGSGGAEGGSGGTGGGGTGGTQSGGTGGTGASSDCNMCLAEKCSQEAATCQANAQCAEASQCVLEKCGKSGSQQELFGCATSQCQINVAMIPPGLIQVAQCAGSQCANGECFGAGTGGTGGTSSGGSGGTGGTGAGGDPGAAPGKINCGPSLTCDVETDGECCISVNGLSPQYSCTKAQCQGGFISIEQPCDGPEDCDGGKVCCGKFSQQQTGVSCADTCEPPGGNGQSFSLCHKDDDCQGGETCQVCSPGFGFTFRICGTECPAFGPGGGGPPGGP